MSQIKTDKKMAFLHTLVLTEGLNIKHQSNLCQRTLMNNLDKIHTVIEV